MRNGVGATRPSLGATALVAGITAIFVAVSVGLFIHGRDAERALHVTRKSLDEVASRRGTDRRSDNAGLFLLDRRELARVKGRTCSEHDGRLKHDEEHSRKLG